jgi:hypothetical protein
MIYPRSDGEGTAGAPVELNSDAQDKTNAAASTQDYWGEPRVIMPVSTVTSTWYFIGTYVTLTDATSQAKHFQGAFYKTSIYAMASRDAGNAWDEGATVLTVDDASPFVVDDLVWIVSSGHPNGEIQRVTDVTGAVVTVERETSQFGAANTGLRWDHTTDDSASEKMYRCQRMTEAKCHPLYFQFESNSTRYTVRYAWNAYKTMPANAGLIARVLNETDNTNDASVVVKAIYNHP